MNRPSNKEFSEYIRNNFSSVSGRYDFLNHLLSFGLDRYWRKRASGMISGIKNGVILDLCAGTGDLAFTSLLKTGQKRTVLGIDFSHDMLLLFKKKIKPLQNIVLLRADVLELPIPDESADGITIGFGLRNLADLESGIREMSRVLKDNGSLVILEFSNPGVPIFREIYRIYFRYILPFIGKMISGNGNFYRYLHDSVGEFYNKTRLVRFISEEGFFAEEIKELTFGIVTVYHFKKADSRVV